MPSFATDRTDSELLFAHVAGDRHAFDELFRRHRTQLYRLARGRTQTAEDADDAVQEAMLSAHRGAGSFRHDSAVQSWLHRIVVNACRDRLRHNVIRPTVVLDDDDCIAVPDHAGRVETAIVVRGALMQLPVGQRAAVVAIDMHGYSVAEAAGLLEVAEGTVKSRCSRARARLTALLGGPVPR
ncbi:MAG: RNA polymerase sigma factor SigM [Mycobacterium sp.]|nr:RNA polymerase sigma factor SigM [Mycobacterium sp.]